MQIIADENIPFVREAFTSLGEIRTVVGRHLSHIDLAEASVLLVRSVTQVNEKLLAGTTVRFVGTATIGLDHIDLAYLQQQNIGFASSPGCNATAAAEYVISALLITAEQQGFQLRDKTVGIIGCGNVGYRVLTKLEALGVHCIIHDPPLNEKNSHLNYVDLDTVLSADIITLHVPLSKTGYYPTYHLVNADFLAKLQKDVILVNTSRGAVVDETALLETLANCPAISIILDVWKNEPNINPLLLQRATLGTPHIAGYSFDGKVRGTEMLYSAVCDYFQHPPIWQAQTFLPTSPLTHLSFSTTVDDNTAINTAVMACYDVRRDDAALRRMTQATHPSTYFDNLRKHYPMRREFSCIEIELPPEKTELAKQLRGLGFQVSIGVTLERHEMHSNAEASMPLT
ncbi:4-phosphoerythronate dehydrogenase PdxB [Candidatus Parabeggiatoa sp. HSG14]|uniref:4-phosphoerythronate dehydrogenase PdxB n=1 Tax=Candidatus Parabeggiatoa sp. HSG14 TaxID=3055593 RepID=UPI0025A6D8E8|nr:4-phosphoerythronate dehydrogenase PdxB [Thiotrichales bacterium HSG14]